MASSILKGLVTNYGRLGYQSWHRPLKGNRRRRLQDIAIITYEARYNMCPLHIQDIFKLDKLRYGLRNSGDFFIPRYNTTTYGRHSLRYVGPVIWSKQGCKKHRMNLQF